MSKWLLLLIVLASPRADAETPLFRIGGTVGLQQSDRSAWVFGPSLDVAVSQEIAIRGEGQVELGDLDDPFGDSNFRSGHGPHVNHVFVGATWRPTRFADFALATGAEAGVMIMHSHFSRQSFTNEPALGLFVQAGRVLGPVSIALQLRLDMSATVADAGPNGADVQTTCARLNLAFEVPVLTR